LLYSILRFTKNSFGKIGKRQTENKKSASVSGKADALFL
jgi:hypothetical protein